MKDDQLLVKVIVYQNRLEKEAERLKDLIVDLQRTEKIREELRKILNEEIK